MLAAARARTKQLERRDDRNGHRAILRSISFGALHVFNVGLARLSVSIIIVFSFVFVCARSSFFMKKCALAIAAFFPFLVVCNCHFKSSVRVFICFHALMRSVGSSFGLIFTSKTFSYLSADCSELSPIRRS